VTKSFLKGKRAALKMHANQTVNASRQSREHREAAGKQSGGRSKALPGKRGGR
jgi:hypothetical protein